MTENNNKDITKELIDKIKEKKVYSQLPDSIIIKALEHNENDIKNTRAFLRKYFGIFLTNKIIKGKGTRKELLQTHPSSKKRDYQKLYNVIQESIKKTDNIIDLGCGINGYSYKELTKKYGNNLNYTGIEATKQLVTQQNNYYKKNNITKAHIIQEDLLNTNKITKIIQKQNKHKDKGTTTIFLFQVIDALEQLQQDYTKTLLENIKKHTNYLVITLPTESIGGKKRFNVKRTWITKHLQKHYTTLQDVEMKGERIIILTPI